MAQGGPSLKLGCVSAGDGSARRKKLHHGGARAGSLGGRGRAQGRRQPAVCAFGLELLRVSEHRVACTGAAAELCA